MESGVLNFTAEEYQILEDIEFDETIQRPETIRFYTLDEQTTDAYEKLMPKGRTTRYQRDKVRKEVDRLQDLYEQFVSILPEEYTLREPEVSAAFSWVRPVYATNDTRAYSWDTQWRPLYENLRAPNFYPAMLAALPHPIVDAGEGVAPYALTGPTEFVDEGGKEPLRGLSDYLVPRTQYHEDKTISIALDPAGGTKDSIGFRGYFLQKRPLEIPNPLPEHPFLKANEDTYVPTSAPLKDVVPSLDAILTHAVPVTKDPYGEAGPYLKLYDVKLSSIPWSTWKSKFPPVDMVSKYEPGAPIEFPKPAQLAVPEKIQESYGVKYEPGMSVRLWLMKRLDGGGLVMDLLRSTVADNGSVNIIPGVDLPKAAYPETTPESCALTGKPFTEFSTTGVLRRTIAGDKVSYQCVPLEFIKQERGRVGYEGRLPWKEDTGEVMKKAYLKRLAEVTPPADAPTKEAPLPKTPSRPDSVIRKEVLAIQSDPTRYAEDKVRDIRDVIRDGTTLTKNVYTDNEGGFVLCSHTLALLGGDLATDRQKYYETWTARVDGFRVCKFCGEQINADVFEEVDEYDEKGFKIRNTEALETKGTTGVADYVTGLRRLQPLFVLETPHDDTVFLVLSLLQVLPTADVLEKFLALGRQVAAVQFGKGEDKDKIARFQGMTGLATAALILQAHVPTLVPRRSFGPRPLILSGYPRDSPTPTTEYTIVDTLITVLRKTFEAFPTTFQGPSRAVVRTIMNKPGEVKNTVTVLLSTKSPLFTRKRPDGKVEQTFVPEMLATAKAYVAGLPPVEVPKTLLPVVAPPKEFGVIKSFPACPSSRPIWTSGRPPQVVQATVPLRGGLMAAKNLSPVPPSPSVRVAPTPIPKAEIRARLGTAKAATRIRVGDSYRTNLLLASRLADLFRQPTPLRAVDPTQSPDELRDIARGFVGEQLADIQATAASATRLEEIRTKDVALYILQADPKEEKVLANKLRASERLKIVDDLKKKSDAERELIQQLLSIGAAPYLVTQTDKEMFAREAERIQDMVREEEEEFERLEEADAEVGVGLARDNFDDGDEDERGNDHGDYGDRAGLPVDRDYPTASFGDDQSRSI